MSGKRKNVRYYAIFMGIPGNSNMMFYIQDNFPFEEIIATLIFPVLVTPPCALNMAARSRFLFMCVVFSSLEIEAS